jgi:methyl-accepting chemotaxis protein
LPLVDRANDVIAKLAEAQSGEVQASQLQGEQAITAVAATQQIIAGLALVVGGLIAYFVARAITRPLKAMCDAMNKLAKGNREAEIPALGKRDEIGEMAKAVLVFRDAAVEKARLEQVTAEQAAQTEAQRAAAEDERRRRGAEQAKVVQTLADALGELAEGNVTCRLTEVFPADYEELRRDFNGAVQKLHEAMRAIDANVQRTRSGAGEIAHAADDLSRRTERQAASP